MIEHDDAGVDVCGCVPVRRLGVSLEEVVDDSLCKLEASFSGDNFVRVQGAMALAREYLPSDKFEVYVKRYAEFMSRYAVKAK